MTATKTSIKKIENLSRDVASFLIQTTGFEIQTWDIRSLLLRRASRSSDPGFKSKFEL